MKKFEEPVVEVEVFKVEDVITESEEPVMVHPCL